MPIRSLKQYKKSFANNVYDHNPIFKQAQLMNTSNYVRRLYSAHDLTVRERKSQTQLDGKKI